MKKSEKFDVEKTFPLGKPSDCIDVTISNDNLKEKKYTPFSKSYAIFDGLIVLLIFVSIFGSIGTIYVSIIIIYVIMRIMEILLWYKEKKRK